VKRETGFASGLRPRTGDPQLGKRRRTQGRPITCALTTGISRHMGRQSTPETAPPRHQIWAGRRTPHPRWGLGLLWLVQPKNKTDFTSSPELVQVSDQ